MTAFLTKHSTIILFSVLLTLLILAWIFPSAGLKLGIVFLLLSFLIASAAVLEKHKQAYRQGKISRGIFIRNAALEIGGGFLIMTLAGWFGRSMAELATGQIGNDLLRVIAGILVGLLVGVVVGALAKRTLRRVLEVS